MFNLTSILSKIDVNRSMLKLLFVVVLNTLGLGLLTLRHDLVTGTFWLPSWGMVKCVGSSGLGIIKKGGVELIMNVS